MTIPAIIIIFINGMDSRYTVQLDLWFTSCSCNAGLSISWTGKLVAPVEPVSRQAKHFECADYLYR